jgi:hypothetical protein
MSKLIKKHFSLISAIIIASLFFVITASFNYILHDKDYVKWGSPDETANYFFVKNYALTNQLAIYEPANLIGEEIVRPRSIRSDHGWLRPVSFLGIIIYYGFIASFLGISIIPYITPFLASLGIIFFFLWLRRLFNQRIALISSILLASFPVYIYYTIRSLFHNVLFLVFLIFFLYFISLALSKKYLSKEKFLNIKLKTNHYLGLLWPFLAGIFLGGAIAARTSELIWLLPTLFIAYLFYIRRLNIRVFLVLAGSILAYLPIAYYNQYLFGSFIFGGYSEMNSSIVQISQAGTQFISSSLGGNLAYFNELWNILRDNIFYFGYQPRQSLEMFNNYVIKMFPWLFYMTAVGGFIFFLGFLRKFRRWRLVYLLSWFILSSILVLYYGSWEFFDNPDPSRYTIGNSYTRYWLPLYLLALPLMSLAIVFFSRLFSGYYSRPRLLGRYDRARLYLNNGLQTLGLSSIVAVSWLFVFFGSEEGLIHKYYNHFLEKQAIEKVLQETENNSIIITQYHDKQLFPERKVIVALFDHNDSNETLASLVNYYPIYYYNFFFPELDFNYLNNRRLAEFNLNIELVSRHGPFGLYRLIPYNQK